MEMEILGMNFGCVLGSLSAGNFPAKDCLLPLISKLLGYCIVAASTTVKVPQNKSTGELSFITCFMNAAGSIVRVFTSIQENAPTSMILGSVLGIVTNGTILSQILIYRKPEAKKEKKVQ